MTASPTTWMPLFWGDYLKDTMHLSAEEHGAYLLLIAYYWQNGGPIDSDKKTLQNVTKISLRKMQKVLRFFEERNGTLFHHRIDEELQLAKKNQTVRSSKATHAANARWSASSNAPSMPQALHGGCPAPSPSVEDNNTPSRQAQPFARAPTQVPAPTPPRAAPPASCLPIDGGTDFGRIYHAGCELQAGLATANTEPIRQLLEAGYDVDLDILPMVRTLAERPATSIGRWSYFGNAIAEQNKQRLDAEAAQERLRRRFSDE